MKLTATLPARTTAKEESGPTRYDGPRRTEDSLAPKESMVVGPNGKVEPTSSRVRPPARIGATGVGPAPEPPPNTNPDTPPSGQVELAPQTGPSRRQPRPPPPAAVKLPPIVYAGLGTSIGLFVLTIVSFVVFFVAGGSPPEVEYGVVAVSSSPAGAEVVVDGTPWGVAPTQVPVAVDERTHVVELKLKGHKDGLASFKFEGKPFVDLPAVELAALE